MASFLPGELRVLTRTGVEIHRLQYWDDGLSNWVGQRAKVKVHYAPRDVTYVYVRTPGGTLVKAAVTTPGVSAISLAEWSARRQHERASCRYPALVQASGVTLRRDDEMVRTDKSLWTARSRPAQPA